MSQSVAREGTPYPSQLLESAVEEFAKLPGIGRKTALRLVLYLLRQDVEEVESETRQVKAEKFVQDGKLFIRLNGQVYDITGRKL